MSTLPEQKTDLDLTTAEADIEKDRERFLRSFTTLRDKISTSANLWHWVRQRPGTFLGSAFVLGLLVGLHHGDD